MSSFRETPRIDMRLCNKSTDVVLSHLFNFGWLGLAAHDDPKFSSVRVQPVEDPESSRYGMRVQKRHLVWVLGFTSIKVL